MKPRTLVFLLLASATAALAQQPAVHLSGIFSDFTPSNPAATPSGPWEIRGQWTLDLKGDSGTADFSASMAMGLSDYWIWSTNADPTNPAVRSAHTHHIVMTDAAVSSDPADTGRCPASAPANSVKFVVTGTAKFISANGNAGPFEKKGPTKLQVCVSGGIDGQSEVADSNVTLVFAGPAAGHFGTQPIHGVVSSATPLARASNRSDDSERRQQ